MLSGTYRGKVSGLNCKRHYKVQSRHVDAIELQHWGHLRTYENREEYAEIYTVYVAENGIGVHPHSDAYLQYIWYLLLIKQIHYI